MESDICDQMNIYFENMITLVKKMYENIEKYGVTINDKKILIKQLDSTLEIGFYLSEINKQLLLDYDHKISLLENIPQI